MKLQAKLNTIIATLYISALSLQAAAQVDVKIFEPVSDSIYAYFGTRASLSAPPRVYSVTEIGSDSLEIRFTKTLADYPFRQGDIAPIYKWVKEYLPQNLQNRQPVIRCGTYILEELVSGFHSGQEYKEISGQKHIQWIEQLERPVDSRNGLEERYIALWSGHGFYHEKAENRWKWQRAPFFSTIEDLFTADYIHSFLTPMLENAGAYVLTPKVKDRSKYELTVDGDSPFYSERPGKTQSRGIRRLWKTSDLKSYSYMPYFPETGEYAVYIRYRTITENQPALIQVHHNGGVSKFTVNQSIGGNIPVYLGTFEFGKGENGQGVVIQSLRNEKNNIIAVTFGGGSMSVSMDSIAGNIPRYAEASRYWMQRNGYPESVYTPTADSSDYIDDYKSKGLWVNYMKDSLGIPVDLALALHSDAGVSKKDSIIGTLAIYTKVSDSCDRYSDGTARSISRELADIVQTQIVDDIQKCYRSDWSRRRLADRAYFEARTPDVPTVLIELLSHQNFHDMRCGLDPRFKFIASRAIYKGILKFLAYTSGTDYTVQPLPIKDFSVRLEDEEKGKAEAVLEWTATYDECEPTATPTGYLVQTQITDPDEDGINSGFDSGILVRDRTCRISLEPGKIYSFKVSAVNAGGKSFPSETLSAGYVPSQKKALVINAFNTVCAPDAAPSCDTLFAGFDFRRNPGISYLQDYSYIGEQYEYCCDSVWRSDDAPGFGASRMDYGIRKRAGNTFDYPLMHGKVIMNAGLSFCSTSASALSVEKFPLADYTLCDIITGIDTISAASPEFIEYLDLFRLSGGSLLISGSNLGKGRNASAYSHIFKFKPSGQHSADCDSSSIILNNSTLPAFDKILLSFRTSPNPHSFPATVTESFSPATADAMPLMYYADDNTAAAILYDGQNYRSISFGFPIETITSSEQFVQLMNEVILFLSKEQY